MLSPCFWAHVAHVIHGSLADKLQKSVSTTKDSVWTSEWLLDPISYGVHKMCFNHKLSIEFQIRIMDNGIMFVAVNHHEQAEQRTTVFWLHPYTGENEDISLKDTTGEYKIKFTALQLDDIASALFKWLTETGLKHSALRTYLGGQARTRP